MIWGFLSRSVQRPGTGPGLPPLSRGSAPQLPTPDSRDRPPATSRRRFNPWARGQNRRRLPSRERPRFVVSSLLCAGPVVCLAFGLLFWPSFGLSHTGREEASERAKETAGITLSDRTVVDRFVFFQTPLARSASPPRLPVLEEGPRPPVSPEGTCKLA